MNLTKSILNLFKSYQEGMLEAGGLLQRRYKGLMDTKSKFEMRLISEEQREVKGGENKRKVQLNHQFFEKEYP